MNWNAGNIIARVKALVGDLGLDDVDTLARINDHYQNYLPLEFRPESLNNVFQDTLIANGTGLFIDPNVNLLLLNPGYIDDGSTGNWYEGLITYDPTLFWRKYPEPTALGTYSKGKPMDFLFYGMTLYPRPVPDADYEFNCKRLNKPTALALDTDYPIEKMWGGILACDVAIEIKGERGDEENMTYLIETLRPHYVSMINIKEIYQLDNIRGMPRF